MVLRMKLVVCIRSSTSSEIMYRQLRPGNPITKVKSPSLIPPRLMVRCFFTFKGTLLSL